MINKALRLIRQYHQLSLTQLAYEFDKSKNYLIDIENGNKPVTTEILTKYSERFKIPMSSLVMFSLHINNEKKVAKKFRKFCASKILDIAEWALHKNEKKIEA